MSQCFLWYGLIVDKNIAQQGLFKILSEIELGVMPTLI
ncbi:hypothetical protein SAMN05421863_101141 [Nitrosomonas communis]|uniref:Uncharacterized protein n=1 Tax=Nitrosomonas communis TaxID=44574 RepID=A0A1I4MRA8_9PROT|nr:hypothetical protein SAMN05421863_101141 [Nitrosomonas communis]